MTRDIIAAGLVAAGLVALALHWFDVLFPL